ncbi:UDP-N-acetylmuramoylalanyl-D-glutamyl-2, 6-diaminopimelate-D-alanyl-D-alanyl ligase [beta proteobacterium KB13]|uniref:UDP-N-acetylmuramoyl-tripeptide--D-alanyl-D-alanine ligase n=1 Tax=beta proteobacterium KB13 TaxID=314607 RepID=B6BWE3_9PROT|nr:UDP-N-acetylmuramoylalanyl-D-glutamyl-2, 6-diaminopimelate-D-alanyl-D-alanyl ligase [beta proteobacterium KB13]
MKLHIRDIKHLFIKSNDLADDLLFDSSDVNTDSRTFKDNEIFLALEGDKFDGSNFIDDVLKQKPLFFITNKEQKYNARYAVVESGKKFLIELSKLILKKLSLTKVAITGSNGKTTTKDLIVHFLKNKFNDDAVLFTKGNYNNEIGLPLSILQSQGVEKFAVFEIGTNHPGEIIHLADIIRPNISIITNIGDAHIGNFGSKEKIAEEKKQIFNFLKTNELKILNKDDEYFQILNQSPGKTFCISNNNDDSDVLSFKSCELNMIELTHKFQSIKIKFQLTGQHNLQNFAIACAALINIGIDFQELEKYFGNLESTNGRFKKYIFKDNIELIDDSYNSNPSSLISAIDHLNQSEKNKILIIGDMGELGQLTDQYHLQIIEEILKTKINIVLTMGKAFKAAIKKNNENLILNFSTYEDLLDKALPAIKKDTIILVKASRFMGFENIVSQLKGRLQ